MRAPKKTLSEMQQRVIDAESLKPSQVNAKELLRLEMLSSFEAYTKAMFKAQYKRNFIVAEHHKKIINALQDVVDGKCTRLIINMPPRYGKCCAIGTQITLANGTRKSIESIKPGEYVLSFHNGKAVRNKVIATEPAFKNSSMIIMKSGRKVICSLDHPWLTPFGYKKTQELKAGERIYALKSDIEQPDCLSDSEVILISAMLFDGCCTKPGRLGFTNVDNLAVDTVSRAVHNLGGIMKKGATTDCQYYILGGKNGVINNILTEYGLVGHSSYSKRIPDKIFKTSSRQKYLFLGMMIATDGTIKQSGQISIGLANEGLANDIQYLLSTMGIPATLNWYPNAKAGIWNVAISRRYAQRMFNRLDFYGKANTAAEYILKPSKIERTCTYPYSIIQKEGLYKKVHIDLGYKSVGPGRNMSEDTFKELVDLLPDKLGKYWAYDFYPDEIKDVVSVGAQELIHLEVENDHNFIANGLVSHNTELAIKSFISWCMALNPRCRFLHLSYSDVLVADNSDTVRSIMQESLYKELFPGSKLEKDKASNKRWRTAAGGEMYAVSTQGQVTGFGAGNVDEEEPIKGSDTADNLTFDEDMNVMLGQIGAKQNVFQGAIMIDDPIKPEDADSDIVRERINLRFENTIRNRTNSRNTPIIIIMQRLHEHDLCGYLQEIEPDEWTVLSLPAIQEDPVTHERHALWPMKHTLEELDHMREINPMVFDTQYMQDPTPKEGLMYSEGFKTYSRDQLPQGRDAAHKWNYTDTADTGADNLCSICFIDTPEYCYVTDVLFTDAPMEKTEPQVAEMLTRNQTVSALIESNNGGRGFSRNVKKLLRVTYRNFRTTVRTFTQSEKKATRIFTASGMCQNDILFPEGWEKKWPKFYAALTSYRKDNKKKQHDDAPDALTGVSEMHSRKHNSSRIRLRN